MVYLAGFRSALAVAYTNPALQVYKLDQFPIWLDQLDRTFFFLVDHRRVSERADVLNWLKERSQCADKSSPAMAWDLEDAQGWEPWNQLTPFEIRDGMLVAQSRGNDPYMASPEIDIPALAIGDIEITMRVRASQPTMQGAVYWHASSQPDFAPDLYTAFAAQADGEFHTYRVDIAQSGKLRIGDRIVRLRLDPVDAPGEIAIRSIRVFVHCSVSQGDRCTCAS